MGGADTLYSQNYACPDCGISLEELEPRAFSFNNPYGACPTCTGLGELFRVDPELVVPDKRLSLSEGAISVSGWNSSSSGTIAHMYLSALCRHFEKKLGTPVSMDTPFADLPAEVQKAILYGCPDKMEVVYEKEFAGGRFLADFEGIVNNLERRYRESTSDWSKGEIEGYMSRTPCPACHGKRLKPESLAVTVGGLNIAQLSDLSVKEALRFLRGLTFTPGQAIIAQQILHELDARLTFLMNVGLGYLTLSRAAGSLSGGESQRIRLATQIGSGLVGVLYILATSGTTGGC